MTPKLRKKLIILAIIPVLSFVYGIGDYFSWWDTLQGIGYLEAFHARLESNKGFPTIAILNTENDFDGFISFIAARTTNGNIPPATGGIVDTRSISTTASETPEQTPVRTQMFSMAHDSFVWLTGFNGRWGCLAGGSGHEGQKSKQDGEGGPGYFEGKAG